MWKIIKRKSLYLFLLKHTPFLYLIDLSVLSLGWIRPWEDQMRPESFERLCEGSSGDWASLESFQLPPHRQHTRRLREHFQRLKMSPRRHGRVRFSAKRHTLHFLFSNYVLELWLNDVKKDTQFENRFGCKGFECNADIWIHLYGRLLWSPVKS